MKNMKVQAKFIVTFALILAVLVGVLAFGIIEFGQMSGMIEEYGLGTYAPMRITASLSEEIEQLQKEMYQVVMGMEDPNGAPTPEEAATASATFAAIVAEANQLPFVMTHDVEVANSLIADLGTLGTLFEKANTTGNTLTVFETEMIPLLETIVGNIDTIDDANSANADIFLEEMYNTTESITLIFAIFGAVAIILVITFCIVLTNSFVKPLRQMEAAANKMAEGNLKIDIAYTSKDEMGIVSQAMRSMSHELDAYVSDINHTMTEMAAGNLNVAPKVEFKGDFIEIGHAISGVLEAFNSTLSQISSFSEQVSAGSEQVSSGAQALSQGATEQASSLQQLAASISEISSQINDNAANAVLASESATYVGTEMEKSNIEMEKMIAAMNDISQSSSEISKIVKTIEDIAFQTNLLALNAAVEAAHAGSAGRSFAVVADEVRTLASKSAEASKDTAVLIENTLKAVQNGVQIAADTASALTNVAQNAGSSVEAISKISDASSQQAEAISQITIGVDQISAVVQTNSATSEQSAAASEQLSAQAQVLKNLVGEFRLKGTESHISSAARTAPAAYAPKEPQYDDYDYANSGASKY